MVLARIRRRVGAGRGARGWLVDWGAWFLGWVKGDDEDREGKEEGEAEAERVRE